MRFPLQACLLALGAFALSALLLRAQSHGATTAARDAADAASADGAAIGYPPGPWWRVADQLNELVLSGAHILIAHRDSDASEALPHMALRDTDRSRAQAQRRALQLQRTLAADPQRFAKRAQRESDDRASAPRGGDLGVFRGNRVHPALLNAFASIEVGQLSRVVETPMGFHILWRTQVPAAQMLSARQIVIKHRDAIGRVARDRDRAAVMGRSRPQARALAEAIRREALAQPSHFAALARAHSESYEASQGGDIGAYSTHEPDADPLVTSVVSRLQPGAISAVVDGPLGYTLYQRSDATRRERLAASQIIVGHRQTPDAARVRDTSRTREKARSLAAALHAQLSHGVTPEAFEALRQHHCDVQWCQEPVGAWSQGRANPDVDAAVRETAVGALATRVIESELGFHVILRRDATGVPQEPRPALRLEAPRPTLPPLLEHVEQMPPERLPSYARVLHAYVSAELSLSTPEREALEAIVDAVVLGLQQEPPAAWPELMAQGQREARALLGARRGAQLDALVDGWYRRQMLGG